MVESGPYVLISGVLLYLTGWAVGYKTAVSISSLNFKGDRALDYERSVENISKMSPGLTQWGYIALYLIAMTLSFLGVGAVGMGIVLTAIDATLKLYARL